MKTDRIPNCDICQTMARRQPNSGIINMHLIEVEPLQNAYYKTYIAPVIVNLLLFRLSPRGMLIAITTCQQNHPLPELAFWHFSVMTKYT